MAYVITDLNDFEIQISDGFRDIVIWKQNIRFGAIVGDELTLYWHNKAQTDTQYQLTIDWNDVTAPVVVSAADLQIKLEGFIVSGWGGGGSGVSLSAGGVTVSSGTVVFSNANSVTFGMAGSTVTASVSTPAQSEYFFSNANGVSFGTAGSTVTASHNGITSQSVQTQNAVSVLGSTGDISFANSNGITFGGNASTITASYTVPTVTNSSWTASAGTQSATVSQLVWSNSNGVSFGLDNGTITASHNGLTTQTVQPVAVSGSNGSFSFNTLTAGNLNGLSFYTSNGSLVGSYTVPLVTNSSWTASAGTQSATVSQLVFSNSNGISFGLNNGTITGSHNGLTVQSSQPINISITGVGTFSGTSGSGYNFSLSFDNLSAGISGNTIRVSHQRDTHTITAANGSATYGNQFGMFNLNGVSFSTTDSGGIRGFVASHNGITSQSVQPVAVSGSNGSFNFSTVTFGNLNGISFYTSNGSMVASYTVPAGGSPAISGSNGSFTFNTVTFGNLNGASFYSSNGSMVLSYTVPAAGGALSFSAGTTSNTFNSLVFSNSNGVSFGLNGSTVTASVNAGGADITLSGFPDPFPSIVGAALADSGTTGNTGGSTQITGSIFLRSWQLPHPVVFDNFYAFNMHSATSAGTGSATVGHAIGIYSLNANTALSLVSSFHWQMYVSQNSVTARTHHWFWGNASNANSSSLSGNVSASFTGANAIPKRILISSGNALTLDAGNYYIASMFTARTAGVNVFACSNAVEGISAIASFNIMMGQNAFNNIGGFIGGVSSTFNMSTIAGLSLPSAINTSAISRNATIRLCPVYLERSKS